MKANTSSAKTEEATEATSYPAAYASLFSKGLERVVEVSKTSLDLAVEQNAEVLGSCRKALEATSSMPGLFLFDLASQAFEGYIGLQKSLLELTVEQSTAILEAAQGYSYNPGKLKSEIVDTIRRTSDRKAAAGKSVPEAAPKPVVSEIAKQQPSVSRPPVPPVVKDSVQPGVVAPPAQKAVALAPKQAKTVSDTAKQQPGAPVKVADIVQLEVDTLLAKEIADLAVKQPVAEGEIVKPQPGITGTPLPAVQDAVQRGADTPSAKEIADTTLKPLKSEGPGIH
jgi:hypothetical protein